MDRFTSIAVFVAAIDEGSLVAAGRRFGLSASMAGKYLSGLEAQLNVRLIQRSTRKLSATEAGRAYYLRCKRILEEFDEANREAGDASATPRGLLRIAAPVSFGALHLGELVALHGPVPAGEHRGAARRPLRRPAHGRHRRRHPHRPPARFGTGGAPAGAMPDGVVAAPDYVRRHGMPATPDDLRDAPRLAFNEVVTAE